MALIDDLYAALKPYMEIGKVYKLEVVILPPGEGFVIHFGERTYFSPW